MSAGRGWVLEVRISSTWTPVRPAGGEPYVWATEAEADRMRRMCYPGDHAWPAVQQMSRVKEIT